MTLLDPEHTIQMSLTMAGAVASVRSWLNGATSVCLVVGAPGAGKSHLLRSAQRESVDPLVMPPPDGTDCTSFLDELNSGIGRRVIADDLDQFSKDLREDVIKRTAARRHLLLASVTELPDRVRNLLLDKWDDAAVAEIDEVASRVDDVKLFVGRWLTISGITADELVVLDCTKFCCASGLPHGFRTLEAFLAGLAESGWDFTGPLLAADAATAYRQATSPPPSRPTILVEGYTDRVYLEWLLQGLASPPAVEVRDCGSASFVTQQAIALRNQGRPCVAVLDSDKIGKSLAQQLKDFKHPVVSVPVNALSLPKSAFDHVLEVAEIEDLLPVSDIERFFRSQGRQPELEIRAPTGVRYVVGKSDKRALATWVTEEVDRQKVPRLSALLADALKQLGITV